MKQLLFLLLLSATSFGQIKINPIPVGYPAKQATDLSVLVMPFSTDAKTCQLYYQLKNVIETTTDDAKKETVLADGNLSLTESEFTAWGQSNKYLEDLALTKLSLTRKNE
jgi:hypothetical protein